MTKDHLMSMNDKPVYANLTGAETWYVMGTDKVIYGPVPSRILYQWAAENRIVIGSRVSIDKSSWVPAETLPILKMDWTATLAGGRLIGPFNILAVPNLFQTGTLPDNAAITNHLTGKALLVHDLVARVPKQNTSDEPRDREGISRPPVGGCLPSAVTPTAPVTPPQQAPPPAAVTPTTPLQEAPSLAAQSEKNTKRNTSDDTIRRDLDRTRKDLSDKVLLLEDAIHRAEAAEDQMRMLTEKSSEREASLKKEVELLKKEFVATQREALHAEQHNADTSVLQQELQTRDQQLAEAAAREETLRRDHEAVNQSLANTRADMARQDAATTQHIARADAAQAEGSRIKEQLSEQLSQLSGELAETHAALADARSSLVSVKTETQGQQSELARLQALLHEREKNIRESADTIRNIEHDFEKFRADTTTQTHTLGMTLADHETTIATLRNELAESRKHVDESTPPPPSVQAELDRTRNESTRIILQHQATLKSLQTAHEELTGRHQELTTTFETTQQECARLKATSTAMGQLQRQEAESLRQQLTEAIHRANSDPATKVTHAAIAPTPAPATPTTTLAELAQLQAEWEQERETLEARLDEAIQARDPARQGRRQLWRTIILTTVVSVLFLGVGYLIGRTQQKRMPIEDVIAPEVLAEFGNSLFQSSNGLATTTASTNSVATHTTSTNLSATSSAPTIAATHWPEIKAKGGYVLTTDTSCRIILNQGLFANSTNLAPDALEILGDLARAFTGQLAQYELIIQGHTDNTPVSSDATYSDNLRLGLTRAEMVRKLLVDQFSVQAAAIRTVSSGEVNPPYPNDTEESRLRNRTVTFELKPVTP